MPSAPAAHDASGCERDVYHPCTNPPALTSDPGGTRLTPRRRARVLCNSAFCRRVRSATLLATLCPRIRPQRASDPLNRRNVSTFRCRNPLYCKGLRYRPGVWGSGGRRFESCRPDVENQRLTASLVGAVCRLGCRRGGIRWPFEGSEPCGNEYDAASPGGRRGSARKSKFTGSKSRTHCGRLSAALRWPMYAEQFVIRHDVLNVEEAPRAPVRE